MLPTSKQLWAFTVLLLVMLLLSISDFSVMGMPWDAEIQPRKYPDIASDRTACPGCTEISIHKMSMKRKTHYDLDRRNPE